MSISSHAIVFDAGPIINLTLNNLLWILPRLKHDSGLRFYIPYGVKEELIDRPLKTKKYKLEALQILPHIVEGTLEVLDDAAIHEETDKLDSLINSCMRAKGSAIKLLHRGELTALAAYLVYDMRAFALDERTTRYLVETPSKLKKRMERKLHTPVTWDQDMYAQVKKRLKGVKCIRSTELIGVAVAKGLFCHYTHVPKSMPIDNIDQELTEGLLWALKLNGCAISEAEVLDMTKIIMQTKRSCSP